MEGDLGFLSPARPSRVSSERGFGSPTWLSPLGTLLDSPSPYISESRAGGDGVSGFSSPTWGSPLEKLFNSPSSCVSEDIRVGGSGSGFSSPTWGSLLETLFYSPASCVSDSRGDGNGSGFSKPKQASLLETLLNPPSSSVSDGRGCGNSSSPRVSKERDSEVQKAERLLHEIAESYDDCFLRLRNATAELANLRRERTHLGAENLHLSLLLEELEAAEQSKQASAVALNLTLPPRPVQAEAASGRAPKSISMRSKSFLSPKQPLRETHPCSRVPCEGGRK